MKHENYNKISGVCIEKTDGFTECTTSRSIEYHSPDYLAPVLVSIFMKQRSQSLLQRCYRGS